MSSHAKSLWVAVLATILGYCPPAALAYGSIDRWHDGGSSNQHLGRVEIIGSSMWYDRWAQRQREREWNRESQFQRWMARMHNRHRHISIRNASDPRPSQIDRTAADPGTALDNCTDNPVIIASGEKLKDEPDFGSSSLDGLEMRRTYRSFDAKAKMFGPKWLSSYDHATLHYSTGYFFHVDFPGIRTPRRSSSRCPTARATPTPARLVRRSRSGTPRRWEPWCTLGPGSPAAGCSSRIRRPTRSQRPA